MIQLNNVIKHYGNTTALNGVSLSISQGEFFALLGPNGAGKTTIIRILLDFTRADSGSSMIRGISSTSPLSRQNLGYLPENLRIPLYLTGREYLNRQASLCNITGKDAGMAIDRVLETVGMKGREKNRAGTYSKGMLQRIGLGAAMLSSPQVLILDEPTTGLDPIGIRDFRNILENLKGNGITLLLNSHILSEVERLCTTAAIMNTGKIIIKDTIASLIGDGESLEDLFIRLTTQ